MKAKRVSQGKRKEIPALFLILPAIILGLTVAILSGLISVQKEDEPILPEAALEVSVWPSHPHVINMGVRIIPDEASSRFGVELTLNNNDFNPTIAVEGGFIAETQEIVLVLNGGLIQRFFIGANYEGSSQTLSLLEAYSSVGSAETIVVFMFAYA